DLIVTGVQTCALPISEDGQRLRADVGPLVEGALTHLLSGRHKRLLAAVPAAQQARPWCVFELGAARRTRKDPCPCRVVGSDAIRSEERRVGKERRAQV